MTIIQFPPVESANSDGLLMIGGDLEVPSLLLAYKTGVFPWPLHEGLLTWFSPPKRTVLFFDNFHIARRLRRLRQQSPFSFKIDKNFTKVIQNCAASNNRTGQSGTWITTQMIEAYITLHRAGYAHSFEAYYKDNLIGGVYGVAMGQMFAGESMFYLRPNASKLAFCFMIDYLQEHGCNWIDCQVMTPLLKSFGAVDISRTKFSQLLNEAINQPHRLFTSP